MNYNKKSIQQREKQLESRTIRNKKRVKLYTFRILIVSFLAFVAAGAGLGFGVFRGIIASAPGISEISIEPTGYVTTICDKDGNAIQTLSDYTSNRIDVSMDQIPQHVRDAFVAIEDARFYEHKGIDVRGMVRALFSNLSHGRISEGASTITQQLIKNNVFHVGTGESNMYSRVRRKIQEQYLALQVEKKYSKSEILKNYLNTINLGQGTLGVEAASKKYFDKSVSDLTLSEAAVIAAITRNPTYYDPVTYPEHNKDRQERVLGKMLDQDMITEDEYNEALQDDVYDRIQKVNSQKQDDGVYSYFVDALIQQIVTDLQENMNYTQTQAYNLLYSGGLTIYSTQDSELQDIVDSVVNDEENYPSPSKLSLTYRLSLKKADGTEVNYSEYDVLNYWKDQGRNSASLIYSSKKKAKKDVRAFKKSVLEEGDTITGESFSTVIQPQASFTLIDQKTGKVKALAGGRGKKTSNLALNRSTSAPRQPGSTFKVLSTYLPALDTKGKTLASIYDDAPYNYAGTNTKVNNWYSGYYRGLTTVRDAIAYSLNIIAAKTMEDVTPQVGYDYLLNLGFTTLVDNEVDADGKVHSDIVQPLALGGITNGVTNMELTAAYSAIANQGVYVEPRLYTKIIDHKGNTLYKNKKKSKQVMKETTSWLLTNAMQDVIKKGTGTKAQLDSDMPAAGKTGTTSNDVDFWFTGYTPYYTASVWMGYDINKSFSGGNYPKIIWKKIMDKTIQAKNQKTKKFPSCKGIVKRTICTKSGKLAVEGVCDHDPSGDCTRVEYFAKGTEPKKECDVHTKVTICKDSNLPAGQYCPATSQETRVYLIKEENYDAETWDTPYLLPASFKNKTCNVHNENSWLEEQLKKIDNILDDEDDTGDGDGSGDDGLEELE
ncbi:MAG: PBP1A family penicillin-binding protein [Lachnospiraceae bacterium]|nr:PBP1A family penicillin-binding protein [Lachnospiraceae bacterium]